MCSALMKCSTTAGNVGCGGSTAPDHVSLWHRPNAQWANRVDTQLSCPLILISVLLRQTECPRSFSVIGCVPDAFTRTKFLSPRSGLLHRFLFASLHLRCIFAILECLKIVYDDRGYRYTADWQVETEGDAPHEIKEHTPEHLAAQLELTSKACGEYVKLYQIHSATFESGVLENRCERCAHTYMPAHLLLSNISVVDQCILRCRCGMPTPTS